jgi:hypothetical protein
MSQLDVKSTMEMTIENLNAHIRKEFSAFSSQRVVYKSIQGRAIIRFHTRSDRHGGDVEMALEREEILI